MVLVSAICCSLIASGARVRFLQKSSNPYVCTPQDKEGVNCPLVVDPVCGYKPELKCPGDICNYQTYDNGCQACHDPLVTSYTQGACGML